MEPATQETELTRPLIEALNLITEGGDDLVGDVEEILIEARGLFRRQGFVDQALRLGTIRQGLTNWQNLLKGHQAHRAEIDATMAKSESVRDTLHGMIVAASQLIELSNTAGRGSTDEMNEILIQLDDAVRDLIGYFPGLRIAPETTSPPQQFSRTSTGVGEGTFRTDSASTSPRISSPPLRNPGASYSYSSSESQSSYNPRSSRARERESETRSTLRIDRVDSGDYNRLHIGNRVLSSAGATAARQGRNIHVRRANLSGYSMTHMGDTYD